jgi:hypothetical protein
MTSTPLTINPVVRMFPIVYFKNFFMFFLLYRTLGFIRKVCRYQKCYDRLKGVMVSAVLIMTTSEM